MYKTLIRVGNSLALVVDKPVRELLDIGPETMVRMWTDGRRIVLEPERTPRLVTPPEELGMRQIVQELIELHRLEREHVTVIHGFPKLCYSTIRAIGWANGLSMTATDRDAAIMRRYHACLKSRRAGVSWEATLEHVVAEVVLPPSDSREVALPANDDAPRERAGGRHCGTAKGTAKRTAKRTVKSGVEGAPARAGVPARCAR